MNIRERIANGEFKLPYMPVMSMFVSSDDCKKARISWTMERDRVKNLFKQAVLTEYGFDTFKNANEIFDKAWDKGIKYGLLGVVSEFENDSNWES
jgi:hypothetical protein